ncbi:UDP-galactopyranose mutase [Fusobacterium vincentii ATCC 49256]|uniref:UDP-galactopyranose mutase n=1 Tax=Fusobacterium vincentii ATCC 49256 TaxID=209882 RepID=Q7P736_FUSVC|nr:UDP-galactopyranose mutase [Fusobacterium sp. HMSC064B12]EAA24627.1 UDP-galactopyranose mutase [Fusobacterium vincentii ATCC 49256]OFL31158.1 UDP-galactopyranose mutase [Fusobacterium sp. HMSC064B12]
MKYDYLIVGAGLFGSIFAFEMNKKGKKCLVLEKRSHIGGNVYTQKIDGINVHIYGAHIFHTKNKDIWDYINKFSDFNNYRNQVIANYKEDIFSLPFNMYTFNKMWGVVTPKEAQRKIEEQVKELGITNPKNLEEQAISLVGVDIYKKLIEGYTEKQWGKKCKDLPSFIIKRIPVRYTYDNNYFNDQYQGIPKNGYTLIIKKMLEGIEVKLDTNFFDNRDFWEKISTKIIFTGMIDEYYDYCFGELEYRSLKFQIETLNTENYQGNAVVNYTDKEVPYTRIIEHKYFELVNCDKTVISREYPIKYKRGEEPYYPVNDEKNNNLYNQYSNLAEKQENIIFGGRLGLYKYYDMDQIILEALKLVEIESKK